MRQLPHFPHCLISSWFNDNPSYIIIPRLSPSNSNYHHPPSFLAQISRDPHWITTLHDKSSLATCPYLGYWKHWSHFHGALYCYSFTATAPATLFSKILSDIFQFLGFERWSGLILLDWFPLTIRVKNLMANSMSTIITMKYLHVNIKKCLCRIESPVKYGHT